MHTVALANTPACNNHRTLLSFQSSSTAFAIAVYLHKLVQYICVATCSTTAPEC